MMADAPQGALSELGRLIGIASLTFDEYGYCCLLVDDTTLNLEYDPPSGDLLLYAHMGTLPEQAPGAFYEMLLEGNFFCRETAHATLGIDRAARVIVLYDAHPSRLLDGLMLERIVTRFVDGAEHWKRRIASFGELDFASTRPDHAGASAPRAEYPPMNGATRI